ncbi:hypothetical protein FACHB389_02905 [Nostoc calcicola FACHB-389]|nr:hypothetical protein [Nostoc calcicola FACHB-3891]MDZ8062063.1 hypothetical protein [Nostoc sp. EkiNYC01]OKH41884.1 hypothetical protein FACHB389_02905 [Nostoc calcicola FACHB-389]
MHKNTKRFAAIFVLVFSLIVSLNFAVIAQDISDVPSVNIAPSRTCSVPLNLKTQQVIADNGGSQVKMGDRIKVRVEKLSEAINSTVKGNSFDPRQLVLYLNGYELKNVYAEPTILMVKDGDQKKVDDNWLAFRLERNEPSEDVWNALIGGAKYSINVIVGVGCPNKIAIPVSDLQSPPRINIVLLSWRFWLCLLLLLGVVLLFTRYCRNALRSSGIEGVYSRKELIGGQERLISQRVDIQPEQRKSRIARIFLGRKKVNQNPFSLSISQLAFWTLIIFGSYLVIYGITGNYANVLNEQSLVLLGINSVTAFGSSLIDGQGDESKRKGTQRVSEGFFLDILSDINGVNFHRFQTFIWTVAIGLFFVWEVVKNLAMPEFDQTLLTLQGISSATYLGLRGQEQHGMTKDPDQSTYQKDNSFQQQLPPKIDNPPESPEQDNSLETDSSTTSS